jgi:hypothetical protein
MSSSQQRCWEGEINNECPTCLDLEKSVGFIAKSNMLRYQLVF